MKHGILLAMAASILPGVAYATPVVLTFDPGSFSCTTIDGGAANAACTSNGQMIAGNYGSTPQLAVSYSAAVPNGSSPRASLQFSNDPGYFQDDTGLAYSFPVGGADALSKIIFTPAAGYEVSFTSFAWDRMTATTSGDFIFEVRDPDNALLFTAGNAVTEYTVNTAYFTGPLTFLFGNGGRGSVAVDDIAVDVRATSVTPAVPEAATWVLMIFGFGTVGATLRRRNAQHAFA